MNGVYFLIVALAKVWHLPHWLIRPIQGLLLCEDTQAVFEVDPGLRVVRKGVQSLRGGRLRERRERKGSVWCIFVRW